MKKLYSFILLFAFLIGTLQPILPMIEYQLHEGSIMEVITQKVSDAGTSLAMLQLKKSEHSPTHNQDQRPSLLNLNFYPLGIHSSSMLVMNMFPNVQKFFPPAKKKMVNLTLLPFLHPPRLS